jgi:hypothetical protein
MAQETWIAANRRIISLVFLPPVALLIFGLALALAGDRSEWRMAAGIIIAMAALMAIGLLIRASIRPRVGYRDGNVDFYLRAGAPISVPLEHVEAFFLGHGSAALPVKLGAQLETVTLVARLSRRAEEWSHVEVHPALGRWCDGYVTIRGMWCEPLTANVVERLNRRLHEVKQELLAGSRP